MRPLRSRAKRTIRPEHLAHLFVRRELKSSLTVNVNETAWILQALCPGLGSEEATEIVFYNALAAGGSIYWDNHIKAADRLRNIVQVIR